MKNFRLIIAAILTLCLVQGVWAIAPGGALGGGGKAAQPRNPQEGKVVTEPVITPGPVVDEAQLQSSPEAPITTVPVVKKDVKIGKESTEAESNDQLSESDFQKAFVAHDAKKEMRRQLKESIRKYRENKAKEEAPNSPLDDMLILCVILALFIPPLAVYLYFGSIGTEFWISLILTLLFFLPGVIYSLYVILTN